jgi:2-polyprenyl-3-methyl-5-hydroxy-6-metoxy-1,4-benzoquinol methylase
MNAILSEAERAAHSVYERDGLLGKTDSTPLWSDPFSRGIFSRLPPVAEVIDIGCGHGRFIKILPELGISDKGYLGVDFSSEQVNNARRLHPGYAFEALNLFELAGRYPGRFDGFICAAVLMHVPRTRALAALRSMRASLKTGAVGLLSTPAGIGEAESVTGKMILTLYEPDELIELFSQSGFRSQILDLGQMLVCSLLAVEF